MITYNITQEYKIGDCLELMKELPSDSIDIIIADPPYYKIKKDEWDNQWKTFQDYLDWLEVRAIEMKRVLKNNGSLYMFGDDHRIAYIQVMMDKHFSFLNHLVWYKRNNQAIKGAVNNRSFTSVSERILFYEQKSAAGLPGTGLQEIHSTADCFQLIKDYMRGEYQKVMQANGFKTKAECDEYLNEITETKSVVSKHYFADSQYCFPTLELYGKLKRTGFFVRNYENLRSEYKNLRNEYEALRRPFNFTKGMYEVLDIPIISGKENTEHTTTKPIEIIKTLIKSSMKENSTVLDPFLGSGTTLQVCNELNLNCIGFELSNQWIPYYKQRLNPNKYKVTNGKLTEYDSLMKYFKKEE
ncbi:MAG: site-specific DNA-methyltransferase [Candidatus Peribacteraceae bacterium]|nr:site-specific DNA-methyltransferase [Candidatus Peribacteraceae bacterium]